MVLDVILTTKQKELVSSVSFQNDTKDEGRSGPHIVQPACRAPTGNVSRSGLKGPPGPESSRQPQTCTGELFGPRLIRNHRNWRVLQPSA